MFATSLAVIIAFLCVLYAYITRRKAKRLPPGPPGWPILGCLLDIDFSHLHFSFDRWAKEFGPLIFFRLATKTIIVINCPRVVKRALVAKGYFEVLNDRPDSFTSKYIMEDGKGVLYAKRKTAIPVKEMWYKGMSMYGQGVENYETRALMEINKLLESVADHEGKDFNPRKFISSSVANLIVTLVTLSLSLSLSN